MPSTRSVCRDPKKAATLYSAARNEQLPSSHWETYLLSNGWKLGVNWSPCSMIPGYALHAKGLQRQRSVGPLPSSQKRRIAAAPRINCSSTGRFVPPSIYIGFCLFVHLGICSGDLYSIPWAARQSVVSLANRPVGLPSCPAPPQSPALGRPIPALS